MDIKLLRQILIDQNIYIKENSKNYLCRCIYCGDHKLRHKAQHLYVSNDPEIPVYHCFMCNTSGPVSKLVFDITGNRKLSTEVLPKSELKQAQTAKKKIKVAKTKIYILPSIDESSFLAKRAYIKKRSNFILTPEQVPNLIFNFEEFFHINNLTETVINQIGPRGMDSLSKYVGFLGTKHSLLYCRNVDPNDEFKFRKIKLQDSVANLLDYVSFNGGDPNSKTLVLSEGTFDILGEYAVNSLNLRDSVRLYAAGQSFSYASLLKSICYDQMLYKCDVVILSDEDKKIHWYRKFINSNSHVINSYRIFYNKNTGGDFGSFPINPFEVKEDIKNDRSRRRYPRRSRI